MREEDRIANAAATRDAPNRGMTVSDYRGLWPFTCALGVRSLEDYAEAL